MKNSEASSLTIGQVRQVFITLIGASIALSGPVFYSILVSSNMVLSFANIRFLEQVAAGTLLSLSAGLVVSSYGLLSTFRARALTLRKERTGPTSTFSLISDIMGQRTYSRITYASIILYSLVYAAISGMLVNRPSFHLSQTYRVNTPSAIITVCCGPLGQMPRITVYLTDHLGLLLLPTNLVLLVLVSWLVGLNVGLAVYAYRKKPPDASRNYLTSLGAFVGFFTACPTCAALFFNTAISGTWAISTSLLLAALQPLFIAVSIPVLLFALYLSSRSILQMTFGSCAVSYPADPHGAD